jgi:hypothetical protein
MRNQVYYIKPQNHDIPDAINKAFLKALLIIQEKNYSNIKIVSTRLSHIDDSSHFSEGLDKIFSGKGNSLAKKLNKERGFPILDFPKEGDTTGVNLLLFDRLPSFANENTVVILINADDASFSKVESALFRTTIDLIAVVDFPDSKINEMLSATKAINISNIPDPSVSSYTNIFNEETNEILNRLKGINTSNSSADSYTRDRMQDVVNKLKQKRIIISYPEFLGYLVNEVKFELEESIDLLNWKHRYFGR